MLRPILCRIIIDTMIPYNHQSKKKGGALSSLYLPVMIVLETRVEGI